MEKNVGSATMKNNNVSDVWDDVLAGAVVFLVALPLCIGIALASNAPPLAGVVAGIVSGLIVGPLSGAQVTISGPAAGLTAVVAAEISAIGSIRRIVGCGSSCWSDSDCARHSKGRVYQVIRSSKCGSWITLCYWSHTDSETDSPPIRS